MKTINNFKLLIAILASAFTSLGMSAQESTCTHSSGYTYNIIGNGEHEEYCSNCGVYMGTSMHSYNSVTKLCVCGESCPHDHHSFSNGDATGHDEYCMQCGEEFGHTSHSFGSSLDPSMITSSDCCGLCGYVCTHNYDGQSYTDNGDGRHYISCTICGTMQYGDHNDSNNDHLCDVCGTQLSENYGNCEHANKSYGMNDDDTHYVTCQDCGAYLQPDSHNFVDGTCNLCTHTCSHYDYQHSYSYITSSTSNGDDTHTGTCYKCNKEITEGCSPNPSFLSSHNCSTCGSYIESAHNYNIKVEDKDEKGMYGFYCPDCGHTSEKYRTFENGDGSGMTPKIDITDPSNYKTSDSFNFYDDHQTDIQINFTAQNAYYSRNMKASSIWGTICLPFGIYNNEGIQLYVLDEVSLQDNSTMTFVPVEDGVMLPACTPALFKKKIESGTNIHIHEENALIHATTSNTESTAKQGWKLKGTFTPTTIKSDAVSKYYIASNKFWYAEDEASVPAYRAWIEYAGNASGARNRSFNIMVKEDDATSIISFNEDGDLEDITNKGIYNLNGQKVNQPVKGNIYIINGKKVLY